MGRGFQYSSGRIIGVGRLLQAALLLLAVVAIGNETAPAQAPVNALFAFYVVLAAIVAAATWSNWWLDAKLAGPAHAVDILMFMVLVLATEGQRRPMFALFVFLLLAAAIRWSWRATALTAALLTLLYLGAGLIHSDPGADMQIRPHLVGAGHLAVLSLILIWFGANQWRARLYRNDSLSLAKTSLDELPLETALREAMSRAKASTGLFVWRGEGAGEFAGLAIRGEAVDPLAIPGRALAQVVELEPFVYDYVDDRALTRDSKRNLPGLKPTEIVAPPLAGRLALREGLAIPIRSDEGEGAIFLERVTGLSTDHIELGEQIAADIADYIRRHALLKWADENAEARSRLSLARDLHDSVVQFLAGAAFRLEAMKRSEAAGRPLEADLNELKQLMLHEQRELRSFITSLRSGSSVAFGELASDLQDLAGRLSQQWGIRCNVAAQPAETRIPTRFHVAAHQLMREAVANAVRHAGAKSVRVELAMAGDVMRIKFVNDGAAFPMRGGRYETPASLKERVEEAGGKIDVSRGMDMTRISVSMPITGSRS